MHWEAVELFLYFVELFYTLLPLLASLNSVTCGEEHSFDANTAAEPDIRVCGCKLSGNCTSSN